MDRIASGIGQLAGWRRALASVLAGALTVLALAPFHLWFVPFVTLPVLVWLLDGAVRPAADIGRWRSALWPAAATGWWFGLGYFLAGLYWIGFAFVVDAEKFAVLLPLAVVALPAGLALFYALAAMLAAPFWRPGAGRVFALAFGLFLAEWLRGHVLTGFPWNLLGYTLTGPDVLMQSVSLFSVYGLTLLAVLIFASPAAAFDPAAEPGRRRWLLPALAVSLLAGGALWGAWRLSGADLAVADGVRLRLVQPNIPQADKWRPENRRWIFQRFLDLTARAGAGGRGLDGVTHVIWPESSMPFIFMVNGAIANDQARDTIARLLPEGTSLILGAERAETAQRDDGTHSVTQVFNSLFVLDDAAAPVSRYDKTHLVPFGEYLPLQGLMEAIGIRQLTDLPGGFDRGSTRALHRAAGMPPFSPLICYEIIFPGGVVGGDRPRWLLNLTNDAWFGTSTGPYQHLHQARVRAVEEGLPVIRAANTGVSAIIDGYGRLRGSLALNEAGVIDSTLPVALMPTSYALLRQSALIMLAAIILLMYRIIIKVEWLTANQARRVRNDLARLGG